MRRELIVYRIDGMSPDKRRQIEDAAEIAMACSHYSINCYVELKSNFEFGDFYAPYGRALMECGLREENSQPVILFPDLESTLGRRVINEVIYGGLPILFADILYNHLRSKMDFFESIISFRRGQDSYYANVSDTAYQAWQSMEKLDASHWLDGQEHHGYTLMWVPNAPDDIPKYRRQDGSVLLAGATEDPRFADPRFAREHPEAFIPPDRVIYEKRLSLSGQMRKIFGKPYKDGVTAQLEFLERKCFSLAEDAFNGKLTEKNIAAHNRAQDDKLVVWDAICQLMKEASGKLTKKDLPHLLYERGIGKNKKDLSTSISIEQIASGKYREHGEAQVQKIFWEIVRKELEPGKFHDVTRPFIVEAFSPSLLRNKINDIGKGDEYDAMFSEG